MKRLSKQERKEEKAKRNLRKNKRTMWASLERDED